MFEKLFRRKKVSNNLTPESIDDVLLESLIKGETITRDQAMMLPAVSSAVDFISGAVACMPVKLYKVEDEDIKEVNDRRTRYLNSDTGDTLDGYQLKKAMVEDYLMDKGGYCYIKKSRNNVSGLFYVETKEVSVYTNYNLDPINKKVEFKVNGKTYKNYEMIKLLRNTKDGGQGIGVTDEVNKTLETAFSTLCYQLGLVKTGGNKKGFLLSENKLSDEAIKALKEAWTKLYKNNSENVVILNNGVKFQESSNSSVEMQLNENKKELETEINRIFHIEDNFNNTFKKAIFPVVRAFETALNSTLLLENEKDDHYFKFDIKEIVKADIKERYEAYRIAITSGFKTINEVRKEEDMNKVPGMDVLNLGLGAVLYDTEKKTYYTPNTGKTSKGGEHGEE